MKYGVLMHKTTRNLGDDIQSYAIANLLPSVDYSVDRENLDAFRSKDDEPVAVVMAAWWLWKKWNWPPAKCIIPKMIGMHITDYSVRQKASTITDEWLQGIGGEYFNAYSPVGARDFSTLELLKRNNIDCYFSGCITLTLPKQEETADAKSYVCLVDLNQELESAARKYLENTGLEIRVLSHDCDYKNCEVSYEERMKRVKERLTIYQNARLVITRRLHVSLPCLAMETPVLSVVNLNDSRNPVRWNPYQDWVYYVSNEDFISGNFDYDMINPPKNKETYKEYRESLISDIKSFVRDCENEPVSVLKKTGYTEEEAILWQNQLMKNALDMWLEENRKLLKECRKNR